MKELSGITTILIVIGAMLFAGSICFIGQPAGLPSQRQTELVFGSPETLKQLTPVLIQLRNKVYESYKNSSLIKKNFIPGSELVRLSLKGETILVPEIKLHAMRSALTQSRYPDEPTVMAALSRINPKHGQFNPHFTPYGGVLLYSCGAAIMVASTAGILRVTSDISFYFDHPADLQKLFIVPKVWAALIGLFAIPFILLLGKNAFGETTGVLAALFLAVTPAFGVEAHCLKPYLIFLPFMILSMFFALRSLKVAKLSNSVYAGLFAGLSAGALLLSGTVIFALIAATFFKLRDGTAAEKRSALSGLCWGLCAAVAAFLITNPFYLLSFHDFVAEMAVNSKEVGYSFSLYNVITQSWWGLQKTLGLALYLLVVPGMLYALVRRTREDMVLISVLVPYYIYDLITLFVNPHYDMPMVPVLLVLAARALSAAYDRLKPRFVVSVAGSLLIAVSAANCIYYATVFERTNDLYYRAGEWINTTIAEQSSISADAYPYFSSPSGYPPFQLLNYQINTNESPDYYLVIRQKSPFSKPTALNAGYQLLQRFELSPVPLDRLFSNNLAYFVGQPIEIYKKPEKTNANN